MSRANGEVCGKAYGIAHRHRIADRRTVYGYDLPRADCSTAGVIVGGGVVFFVNAGLNHEFMILHKKGKKYVDFVDFARRGHGAVGPPAASGYGGLGDGRLARH